MFKILKVERISKSEVKVVIEMDPMKWAEWCSGRDRCHGGSWQ